MLFVLYSYSCEHLNTTACHIFFTCFVFCSFSCLWIHMGCKVITWILLVAPRTHSCPTSLFHSQSLKAMSEQQHLLLCRSLFFCRSLFWHWHSFHPLKWFSPFFLMWLTSLEFFFVCVSFFQKFWSNYRIRNTPSPAQMQTMTDMCSHQCKPVCHRISFISAVCCFLQMHTWLCPSLH